MIFRIVACGSPGVKEILDFFVLLFQGSRTSNICLWKEYCVHMKLLYLDCEAQNLRKSPVYCRLYFATNEIRRPSYAKIPLYNFRMRVILAFNFHGRGTFALRRDLKAVKRTICELRRQPDNQFGKIRFLVE